MATIKSYTDLEQSKILSKILPLESADMYYSDVPVREWVDKTDISKGLHAVFKSQIFAIENLPNHEIGEGYVYAWSLAALLSVLPDAHLKKYIYDGITKYYATLIGIRQFNSEHYDNPIDACYESIIKLHENNLL